MSKKIPQIVKDIQNYQYPEVDYSYQKSISYSQLQMYRQCPHKWDLNYPQKKGMFDYNIHTVFGTSMHESLQKYLDTMYTFSGVKADQFNIEKYFQESFIKTYKEGYDRNNHAHFSDPIEMREFFDDGVNIINWFKKKRGAYFTKKGWHLVGIEVPIVIPPNIQYNNLIYKGFLDVVMYHEPTNKFLIIDIKTSTRGWNDKTKKDEDKQFQLILYKHFFSKQFDIPKENIDIQFFIVKRKIWEESEYPMKRVQEFAPPSGKNKTNKAVRALDEFLKECFDTNGQYIKKEHKKNITTKCEYCMFNNNKELCDKNGFL